MKLFRTGVSSLLAAMLTLAGCALKTKPIVETAKRISQIRYSGEIKGVLGGKALHSPTAIAFDQSNNIYITDKGNNRIVKLRSDYAYLAENDGVGLGLNSLSKPSRIVSDEAGGFFIFDEGNRRIVQSNDDLVLADVLRFNNKSELQSLGKVSSIAYTRFGRMYLVDPDNLKVVVLDKNYAVEKEIMPDGGFERCTEIAVSDDGSVFVYDSQQKAFFGFDTFGNFSSKIAAIGVDGVGGLIIHEDELIVTDPVRNEVAALDMQGNRLYSAGGSGTDDATLSGPSGLGLRSDNRLFVCDTGNNRIVIYDFFIR